MKLNFEKVYPLLFMIPIVIILVVTYIKYSNKSTRQRIFLGLRSLALLFIILAMCGVSIVNQAKDTTTIFVSDLSDSTKWSISNTESFIQEAIKTKKDTDRVGIVTFGMDSITEYSPNKEVYFDGFQTTVNGQFTNIQNALIYASSLYPPDTKKRIVLITDGYENSGDSERQIKGLVQNNTAIDIYSIANSEFPEVQLSSVVVPEKAGENQMLDVTVDIVSNIMTDAVIKVYSNNRVTYEQEVNLDVGTNKFVFTDTVSGNGILPYRVEVIAKTDTYVENNYLSTFCVVNDQPVILLVQEEDGQGNELIKMFEDSMNIEVKLPEEVPETIESLLSYDAFILADVPAERLSTTFMDNLESVIKHQGKGLLVTGGDSSYGPGGYFQTPLETVLPVNMEVKPKEETPNLGLVLVIDKSGSMTSGRFGITKLELAKEAAIRATEVLDEKDMLGVIAFDDTPKWVVDMQIADKPEELRDMIATIVPGGGTTIRPSLQAAVDTLKDADTKLKHIILLTDGQAETTGYDSIIKEMRDNDITISTVAVGQSSDLALLRMLANAGNGRYYLTDEFTNIPTIFAKEAFMAGKKYLNNITFSPALKDWSQILKGINAIPELDGYVATSMKDTGRLILSGPDDDPILATWQYGLGHTAAWTSDTNGLWTGQWMSWSDSPRFWTNLTSWLIQKDLNKNYTVDTSYVDGKGVIKIENISGEETSIPIIAGLLITPEGEKKEIVLEASAPGVYTGTFIPEGQGVYMVDLLLESEGNQEKVVTGVNVGYSPEYNFDNTSRITPERIAALSGGRILDDPKEVFKGNVPPVSGSKNISNLLLIISLSLFMLEIIMRKTNFNLKEVPVLRKRKVKSVQIKEKQKQEGKEVKHINQLLDRKNKRQI